MAQDLYAIAERVNPDLAMVIKRMLASGDLSQAEAEVVWLLVARLSLLGKVWENQKRASCKELTR
jgi:hypothetical protein